MRATAWVAIGSVASMAFGLVAMKAYALIVGPEGVGLIGLMQSLVNIAVIIVGIGVTTSAISAMSNAVSSGDATRVATVRRAALLLPLTFGSLGAGALIVLREPAAAIALGSADRATEVVLLAAALLFSITAAANVSVLNGRREIAALTFLSVATAAVAAVAGIALVWTYGLEGLAPAVLAGAGANLVLAWWFQWRASSPTASVATPGDTAEAARGLISVGAPIAVSQLAGAGAVLVAPVLVLHLLGPADVGYYRAAATISIGYLTVLVAALTQDYLPRLAGAQSAEERATMVERQMRLLLGLSVPAILALLAAGPLVLQLLYSEEFTPSFEVLKWQLVGDLIRIPAWILAFVLLAAGRTKALFFGELMAGAGLVIGITVGVNLLGLAGAGVGYAVAQIGYYAMVWLLVRRELSARPGRLQLAVLASVLAAVTILGLDPDDSIRFVLFATAALLAAAIAWPRIYRLHRAGQL